MSAGNDWSAWEQTAALVDPSFVTVVRIHLAGSFDHATTFVTPEELARAERFRHVDPRRRFLLCRAALRQLLGRSLGLEPQAIHFTYDPHGKPQLDPVHHGCRLGFNVSHSDDWGVIALAPQRTVGIDLEAVNERVRWEGLSQRFFAPTEVTALLGLADERRIAGFYRLWTCKEAYLKATGRGLSFPLSQFCVVADPDQPARLLTVDHDPAEVDRWQMASFEVAPGYPAAVMWDGGETELAFHTWST